MYGYEIWATIKYLLSRLDAFDTWALCKILRIPYTRHMSNVEVRGTTCCSSLSHLMTNRRLQLFGHIARSSSREDHHQALAAAIRQVPPDWKRPVGRPSHTWLCAIEADLGHLNFGLMTAWRKATTRDEWRHIVDTATLQRSKLRKKEWIIGKILNFIQPDYSTKKHLKLHWNPTTSSCRSRVYREKTRQTDTEKQWEYSQKILQPMPQLMQYVSVLSIPASVHHGFLPPGFCTRRKYYSLCHNWCNMFLSCQSQLLSIMASCLLASVPCHQYFFHFARILNDFDEIYRGNQRQIKWIHFSQNWNRDKATGYGNLNRHQLVCHNVNQVLTLCKQFTNLQYTLSHMRSCT